MATQDPFAEGPTSTESPTSRAAAPADTAVSPSAVDMAPSASIRRNDESWVEIASQPSSSSLSSIADEIVTTGLRVGYGFSGPNGASLASHPQRRRRLLQQVEDAAGPNSPGFLQRPRDVVPGSPHSLAGSSQEEYDETESEEDKMMPSSAEHLRAQQHTSLQQHQQQQQAQVQAQPQVQAQAQAQAQLQAQLRTTASDGDDEHDEDDDDDNVTALGMPSSGPPPTFRPQPNAFSHPPSHLHHLQQHRSLPSPPHHNLSSHYARSSSMSQRSQSRAARAVGPPTFMPTYREDNDAALRASLTTLLSCAAAARGLPKREGRVGESSVIASGIRPSDQPMNLRFVPESELTSEPATATAPSQSRSGFPQAPRRQVHTSTPAASAPHSSSRPLAAALPALAPTPSSRSSNLSAVSATGKSKRTAATSTSTSGNTSKSPRSVKKKRTSASAADGEATATFLSPTLLTWVVSAGVVVLVSVVGFGAGFVIGREVGRQESASALSSGSLGGGAASNATSSCGRDIMRSSTAGTLRRFRWGTGMTRSIAA